MRLCSIASVSDSNITILQEGVNMGKITAILQAAQQRAKDLSLPYEGALLPGEAYEISRAAPGAKLVDVRTRAEIDWVGKIPGAVEVEWQTYPGMRLNPHFVAQLEQVVEKEALVMFICRSARRSHSAAIAATQAGYSDCYNVLEGFEGDKDGKNQRNTVGGWRKAGLPWEQN
jgi:rhodanese-related sulfurtransferase